MVVVTIEPQCCRLLGEGVHKSEVFVSLKSFSLGHENKIDCFSDIFLRKTHAGCGYLFYFASHTHN